MKLRVTLTDVARKAGFAKSTVSLALRNNDSIPEPTRRRVRQVADQLGYRPHPVLAEIAAHRWKTQPVSIGSVVAFVTTRHPTGWLLDERAMAGARRQSEALGYRLEHFPFEDYGDAARLGDVLYHRGIRGVIVGQLTRAEFCPRFPWQRFAAIGCNTGFYRPPVNLVVPDHGTAVRRAWNEARERGYRRIGLVLFDETKAVDDFDKVSAFLYCQSQLPPDEARLPVAHVPPGAAAGFVPWCREHQPDCILGQNSSVHDWPALAGYRVPEDIGFVALLGASAPSRTAVAEHHPANLGATAVDLVDIQLRSGQLGTPAHPFTLAIEPSWTEGNTLPVRGEKHSSHEIACSRRR